MSQTHSLAQQGLSARSLQGKDCVRCGSVPLAFFSGALVQLMDDRVGKVTVDLMDIEWGR